MSMGTVLKLIQLRMKERMEYRGAFLMGIAAQIIAYGSNYLVVWLLMKKFRMIDGWDWTEIALLYSIGLFTYSIGATFSFLQMTELETLVQNGNFDCIMIKPVNPFAYVVMEKFNIGYIAHILISGSIMAWSLVHLPIHWTWFKIVYFILIVLSGAMIQAAILSMIGALSFIVVRTRFLFSLFFRVKDFISYPVSLYGMTVQIILIAVVPLAFVNYYPSAFLLSKDTELLSGWGTWIAPVIGPVFYLLAYKMWMYGVNKYQGAGG